MRFAWRCVLVVAGLVAGCLLLAACGGEEELDLDQYFQRFDHIGGTFDARIDTLMEESRGVGQEIEGTRGFFDDFQAITKQALNDVNDIYPPADAGEARDAHDEFVAALAEVLAILEDISDRLADIESPSEVQALVEQLTPSFDAASERANDACLQLQGVADENGIEVDLDCE